MIIFISIYVQEFREDEIKGIEHCTYRRKRYYVVAIKKLRAEMKNKNNFLKLNKKKRSCCWSEDSVVRVED